MTNPENKPELRVSHEQLRDALTQCRTHIGHCLNHATCALANAAKLEGGGA